MTTATLVTVAGLALLLEVWRFQRLMRIALAPAPMPRRREHYPSLSVIRPIKGLDAGARLNARAALDNAYPGQIETIFVFDDDREPALRLVLEAIDEHASSGAPGSARVIFCGAPPPRRTGKLNAMMAGLTVAGGELVAFADSDIRHDRDALRVLVDTLLASEGAGAAFAPVVVRSPARTTGDAAYALTLDGIYGGAVAVAALFARGELPFVMGQLMVLDRRALAAIGGLASVEGQLVDDMYIGARLHAAGYRNVVSPRSVAIIQHGLPLAEFLSTYRRWIAFSLSGIDRAFALTTFRHGVLFWLGVVLSAFALATGHLLAAGLGAVVVLLASAGVIDAHERLGGAPIALHHAWVAIALLAITPLVYPTIFAHREVRWRGRDYALDRHGELAGAPDPLPAPEIATPA